MFVSLPGLSPLIVHFRSNAVLIIISKSTCIAIVNKMGQGQKAINVHKARLHRYRERHVECDAREMSEEKRENTSNFPCGTSLQIRLAVSQNFLKIKISLHATNKA